MGFEPGVLGGRQQDVRHPRLRRQGRRPGLQGRQRAVPRLCRPPRHPSGALPGARALDRHGPPLPDEGGGVARGPGPFPSTGGGAPAQAPAPRPGTRHMSRDRLYTWAGLWRSPSSSWEALRLEDDQAESQLRAPDERSGLPYQLDYRLRWDADWHLREAVFHVESETGVRKLHLLADGRGHWQDGDGEALPAFDGCLDIDIWPSPFTNTFPIRRLGLADGQRAEIRALYIEAPALEPRSMRQAYTRLDASHYLYENLEGSAFKAVLLVDEQGLVIDYPGLFQRL
ncbi:hypothetical protein PAMH27_3232 [Pseudomonas aeruginosa MH27]|nr:hypothetical protein PAMH27_3232 [Pseudomonas aeruginosa MH27]